MGSSKRKRDVLEHCCEAAELLKAAGFVHVWTSMKSEAAYYRWPDRSAVIRVAAHKFQRGNNERQNHPIATTLTFNDGKDALGRMSITDERVRMMTAAAIGLYFMKSRAEMEKPLHGIRDVA
jgi:hypothetical protein